jgi:hypothetical protein
VATQFDEWLEGVRSAKAVPPLTRSNKSRPGADPKWAIGDALLVVPEEHRDDVARHAGLSKSIARSYWRTALAWPSNTRTIAASWTAYRELAPMKDRFTVIQPSMTMRDAHLARTGKPIDRHALHTLSDEDVVTEIVRLMMSPRRDAVVPEILKRLDTSKEGRKAARDRRSAAALRRLDEEIRLVQKERKRLRAEKSPRLRFMEVKRRILDTEVHVEEVGLLFTNPDDRQAVDEEEWRRLAKRVKELSDVAEQVATAILDRTDVLDAEWWDVADTIAELSGRDDFVVDAEIVDED